METVRYNFRLRPGVTATRLLDEEWGRVRWTWNQCVSRDREIVAEGGRTPSGYDLSGELTDWRGRYEWLRGGSQNVQQTTVSTWGLARKAAFKVKGRGRPRFKSRHHALPSLDYTVNGFKLKANRLMLAGGIVLSVVWHRELPNKPTSVRVFRDAVGTWWASFVVKREAEVFPASNATIGFDWGVKVTATATDPAYDLEHAGHGRKAADGLAKYQRRMSRRAPVRGHASSVGYKQAKIDAAKAHRRVARQRKHDANVWARRVVTDHGGMAIEDFKPKFLAKSTMAKKAADARIGACKAKLIEYAERAERNVVLVPPAYTTMTCSSCLARAKQRLELSERIFCCEFCGYTADRDRNAARTILAWADFYPATVESVSHDRPFGDSRAA